MANLPSRCLSWVRLGRGPSAGAVLCFHSVTTPQLPSAGTVHVPLSMFESAIEVARHVGRLVPLHELLQRHLEGRSTSGLIAVTVDDAYASLLSEVGDFIRRQAVPVSVFVVTDAAAVGAQYWWDRIDDLFPRVSARRWRIFEGTCGLPNEYRNGQSPSLGPLRPLRQWLLAVHAGRWPAALEPLLSGLEEETGWQTLQRSMTYDELARLAALPSVDVGVHTASHPVLPLLSDEALRQEISGAYELLREHFPNTRAVLACPFGLFDARSVRIAREAGMMASLTLAGRTLRAYGARDDLPRFCVSREETPLKLRLRLAGVLDWARDFWEGSTPRYPDLPSPTT